MIGEGRVIGLDVGERRTGVAVSDPLGITAQPRGTIHHETIEEGVEGVRALVDELKPVCIVAGLPLNQHGKVGPQAEKVLAFIKQLRETVSVEIVTQDERFTSTQVERGMAEAGVRAKKRKQMVDQLAAQQILSVYLDRRAAERKRATS